MNYVKLLVVIVSIHTLTTQAAAQWTPSSFTNISAQGEPLYYNQPHISLTPVHPSSISAAPAIAVPPTPLSAHSSLKNTLQRIHSTVPTHIPHATTTALTSRTLRPANLFGQRNRTATIAAVHAVINKRHLQRKMDAETFQALTNNPILAHARSWAARALKQSARSQLQQQSLHNAQSRQPSARL